MSKDVVTAIVMSGGGAGGVYHPAVLYSAALDGSIDYPDIVSGTSAGSLAALWMTDKKATPFMLRMKQLEKLFISTRMKDVWTFRFFGLLWGIVKSILPGFMRRIFKMSPPRWGLYHADKLRTLMEGSLSPDYAETLDTQVRLVAVSIDSGHKVVFENGDCLITGALASSAFPGLVVPEEWDGDRLIDGGVRDVTPIDAAIKCWRKHFPGTKLHMRVVSTVPMSQGKEPLRGWTLISFAGRLLDIILSEVSVNDFKVPQDPDLRVDVIRPRKSLPASATDFSEASVRMTATVGREDGLNGWVRLTDWSE